MDDPTRQRWNNFVNGPLAEMNKRNETDLVRKFSFVGDKFPRASAVA